MRIKSLVLAAAMLTGVASCTSKDSDADASTAQAGAAGVELVAIPAQAPPRMEVLDSGQEPRQPLRMKPAVGLEETLEMTVEMTMSMRSGAQAMPAVPVPITKTRLTSKVESVTGDTFHMRQSVESVDVIPVDGTPPGVADQVRNSVEPLTAYRALVRMSDRGSVMGGEVEIPRDLPAMVHNSMQQMTQNLGQLAVPMPEPAIGPGARWTATSELQQNGMKLRQTGEYTLISREGSTATLEVAIRQELVEPEVSVPGMLGAKARVSNFHSSGHGSVELDLEHVAPVSMRMELDLGMAMDVTVMGQHQHMDMDMGMVMTMALVDG